VWAFFHAYKSQYPVYVSTIEGPFEAEIFIDPKVKGDCDNYAKALLDVCQALGIIRNDKNAQKVTIERKSAPMGCRLRIVPL